MSLRRTLAAQLEADRPSILATYARRRESTDARLAHTKQRSDRWLIDDAAQVLVDVERSLQGDVTRRDEITRRDDETRAGERESLRAVADLFEVTIGWLGRRVIGDEASRRLLQAAVHELSRSIAARAPATPPTLSQHEEVDWTGLEERRRIARDLHDRVGHGLSVAHRHLELYELYRETEPVKAAERVERAIGTVRETMDSLAAVAHGLRLQKPLSSLEGALRGFVEVAHVRDVVMRVEVRGDERWAPVAVLNEIFLGVREAVQNALTHAAATQVLVRVDIGQHELLAVVKDDGRGMTVGPGDPDKCHGLVSMRERAAVAGGTLAIDTTPGRGTCVRFQIPLAGKRCEGFS